MGGYGWRNAEMWGMVAHTQKWGDPLAAEGRTIPPPLQCVFVTSPKCYKIFISVCNKYMKKKLWVFTMCTYRIKNCSAWLKI